MVQIRGKIRIIGGQWRSRLLTFPEHPDLRPTANRIRETVFNWLGQDLSGLTCLDLFAGSGALGFEAASRGAASVVMVDVDARNIHALRENKEKLQADPVELVMMDAFKFLNSDNRTFDVIFLDPPYRSELFNQIMPLLPQHLKHNGFVYAETNRDWMTDQQWRTYRSAKAGTVRYQLMEYMNHG
ncbi:16S rRNA (guanine(966)-N(2))-methyltransferase RsmD [Nitrosomonas sp.]|uniref:16S rRNA (guanine(966)-N(2))-methyltransferase RsmD n=1 Tax=Nitrosomonas sp. TaxID=42353 RepID=UPI001DD285BA|nr:16S rRNA (guanine(966)-N(2))-methyltransferase RsmD [Nitrosomonas sp.]MBX3617521.1 16S rRNA (guanine(966)-N(2))-methyltransferase RsmD [Nitrosomonas sp.]